MKTKFLQLLKVKEQKVKDIELELYHVQNLKAEVLQNIDEIADDILELKFPKSGSFAKMNILFTNKKFLQKQKKIKEEEIILLDEKILEFQRLYKIANIEFEKIKYLHDMEVKKIIQNIKEQEQKDMDEVANILFTNKKMRQSV